MTVIAPGISVERWTASSRLTLAVMTVVAIVLAASPAFMGAGVIDRIIGGDRRDTGFEP